MTQITAITENVIDAQKEKKSTIDEQQIGTAKTKFREDFENAIPIEESKRRMIEYIRKYYEDKH